MAIQKRGTKSKAAKKPTPKKAPAPKRTELEVYDLPVEDLVPDEDNPNEMDEATMDQLIEEIRENGFDEPIQVRRHPDQEGKYQIGSGHHRTKAAIVLGMQAVPAIIKDWDDRTQKVNLAKRNALRGDFNKQKLAKLYQEVSKGRDPNQVQRELGFTNPKQFQQLLGEVEKNLSPKQKKKLAESKEKINSMDDLSSVLNRIFKESGSELDYGYMVFSFGGKSHHYFQIGKETEDKLQQIIEACDKADIPYTDFVQSIVAGAELPKAAGAGKKTNEKKKRPVKKPPRGKKTK